MNLGDNVHKQLEDHITWLRKQAEDDSPPAQIPWAHIRRGLLDHALFIEQYVLRDVKDLPGPERRDRPVPEFVNRRKSTDVEFPRTDDEGASLLQPRPPAPPDAAQDPARRIDR